MKKEELLAVCLDEIRSGQSTLEECLTRYPEIDADLRALLEIASNIKAEGVQPSIEFKGRARRRLFEEMQSASPNRSPSSWAWPRLAAVRALAFVVVGLLVVGVAGGGTVFAAQGSLPGDKLYAVKTGFENIQLAITPGAEAKANLHLEFAQKRIQEVTQEVKLNREVDAQALERVQKQFDDALKQLGNSESGQEAGKVLGHFSAATLDQQLEIEQALAGASGSNQKSLNQVLDLTRRGNLIAQVAQGNSEFLRSQPSVSDKKLDGGQFKVDGVLVSIAGRTWNVGGVTIENVIFQGTLPSVGSHVKVEGLVKDGQAFISRLVVSGGPSNATKVEGQVGKTNTNGTTDIGGIPVQIADGGAPKLDPGDKVQLQTGPENGKLKVTNQESPKDQSAKSTAVTGVLNAVDRTHSTLSLKVSGNSITVNIGQARIKSETGHPLAIADLAGHIGQEVKLEELHKTGNSISALSVQLSGND